VMVVSPINWRLIKGVVRYFEVAVADFFLSHVPYLR